MFVTISELPPFIQDDIRRIEKIVKDISTHDYANYVEVLVAGVDDAGRGFCKILNYQKSQFPNRLIVT